MEKNTLTKKTVEKPHIKKGKAAALLHYISEVAELLIAVLLVVAILYLFADLGLDLFRDIAAFGKINFEEFLSQAFSLVIGVELVRMLCNHTLDTIIEVLLFASARQLVIDHGSSLDTLLGVLAICLLFVVRKYISSNYSKEHPNSIFERIVSVGKDHKTRLDEE